MLQNFTLWEIKFSTLFTNVLHVNNNYTIIIHVPSPTYKKIIRISKYLSTSFRSSSCKHLLVMCLSLFILLFVFPDWITYKRIGHSEDTMKPTYSTRVKITRFNTNSGLVKTIVCIQLPPILWQFESIHYCFLK